MPLIIHFGEEELIDGVTINKEQFYRRLVESEQLPFTSQASPVAFQKVYEEVTQAGDSAVVITLASKLSGTYQSACIAAGDFDNIYVVDSQTAAIGAGVLTEYALARAEAGIGARELASELEQKREDVCLVALLDTLEYLKRGGRISKTAALTAEYQAHDHSPGRRSGAHRQGPGLQAGQQPAGGEDPRLRRH